MAHVEAAISGLSQQQKLRSLYRQILREAQRFPSIKRDTLIEDIRHEWRVNAGARDPAKVAHSIEVALRGLETLRKYTGLDKSKSTWSVELEQDPLGASHPSRTGGTPPPKFVPFGSGDSGVGKLE
jgi:LYR motif-containing protein 4